MPRKLVFTLPTAFPMHGEQRTLKTFWADRIGNKLSNCLAEAKHGFSRPQGLVRQQKELLGNMKFLELRKQELDHFGPCCC
jgi:hypothetical protein